MHGPQLITLWTTIRKQHSNINHHSHTYHELVYYLSGSGKTEIGGNVFQFSDHCFAVVPGHIEHSEIHYANSEVICLGFLTADNLPFGFHADPSHVIYRILKDMLREINEQNYGYEDMVILKLKELLLRIFRTQNATTTTKNFIYTINYIKENFHEHISLSDCARQLNISYDYFQHKFKTLTGYSPQQFLMEQRLLASQKMLTEGNYNCTEIAYRCGFCTSAQFSALFKRKYGVTPLQFKKQHT